MALFVALVTVTLKPVVNDPQGLVVRDGLQQLGYATVRDVRIGKHIAVELEAADHAEAERLVAEMCEKLLRNPVIEDARVSVSPAAEMAPA